MKGRASLSRRLVVGLLTVALGVGSAVVGTVVSSASAEPLALAVTRASAEPLALAVTRASAEPLALAVTSTPPAGTVLVSDSTEGAATVLEGVGTPGAAIDVTATTGDAPIALCSTVVGGDTSWSCPLVVALAFVRPVLVTSGPETLSLDLSVIDAPAIDSDPPGVLTSTATPDDRTQPVSGSGAPGADVRVALLDGGGEVGGCTAAVLPDSTWACTVLTLPSGPGPYEVRAEQWYPWAPSVPVAAAPVSYEFDGPGVIGPGTGSGDGGGSGDGDGDEPGTGGDDDAETGSGSGHPTGGGTSNPGPGGSGAGAGGAESITDAEPGTAGDAADGGSGAGSVSFDDSSDDTGESPARSVAELIPVDAGRSHPTADAARPRSDDSRPSPSGSPTSRSDGDRDGSTGSTGSSGTSAASAADPPVPAPVRISEFSAGLRTVGDVVAAGPVAALQLGLFATGMLLLVMVPGGILESTVHDNWDRIRNAAVLNGLRAAGQRAARLWAAHRRSAGRRGGHRRGAASLRVFGSWGSAAAVVAVGAIASVLVSPSAVSEDGAAYVLGLALPFALALVVVNGVPLAVTSGYARARLGRRARLLVRPAALLLTVLSVIASRLAGIEPGFVFGGLLGVAFGLALGHQAAARTVVIGTIAALALGLGSWLAATAVRTAGTGRPGEALLLDTLTAVTVCAVSGPIISLLPLRFLDGHRLAQASRLGWAALYALAASTFGLVLLPLSEAWSVLAGDALTWLICLLAVSLLTAGVWAYFRFVPPPADRHPGRQRPGQEQGQGQAQTLSPVDDAPREPVSG